MKSYISDREIALRSLVEYSLPIDSALAILANESWDAPEPLVYYSADDVACILQRFLDGKLSAGQVTDWADLLECRDDIAPTSGQERLVEIIFCLANPYLAGDITRSVVEEMKVFVFAIKNGI